MFKKNNKMSESNTNNSTNIKKSKINNDNECNNLGGTPTLRKEVKKIMEKNYNSNPKYSFPKEWKFNYERYSNGNPGPDQYNTEYSCNIRFPKNPHYSFGLRTKRVFKDLNRNPGPGSYIIHDFLREKKGICYGKAKRKFIEENFMENLFLPVNYS